MASYENKTSEHLRLLVYLTAALATPLCAVYTIRWLLDTQPTPVSVTIGLVLMFIGAVVVLRPMVSLAPLAGHLSDSRDDRRVADKLLRASKGLEEASGQDSWTPAARAHIATAADSLKSAASTLHESADESDRRGRESSWLDQRFAIVGIVLFVIGTALQVGALLGDAEPALLDEETEVEASFPPTNSTFEGDDGSECALLSTAHEVPRGAT